MNEMEGEWAAPQTMSEGRTLMQGGGKPNKVKCTSVELFESENRDNSPWLTML